ncbi:MAG: hydrolase of the alpha/beta superfamily [Myxococcaceae bacterium]|nr:hydrolase of the alpha/beta superfamily [Myxococcaceae bacterium]
MSEDNGKTAGSGELDGKDIELRASDGYTLAATFYESAQARGVVVISAANGIKQSYYASFARYLAEHGFAALTYDYRGIGGSRRGPLKHSGATFSDWGKLDLSAALEGARSLVTAPLLTVGHSAGAQLLGLAQRVGEVRGAIAVGAGMGTWWRVTGPDRFKGALLMYALIPFTTRLLGYFPSRALKLGEDLPAGVAREWMRWARHSEYFAGHLSAQELAGYQHLRAPWLSINATDDHIASPANVAALCARYPNARVSAVRVSPAEVGRAALGHVGWFARGGAEKLWPTALDFLERCVAQPQQDAVQ